MEACFRQPLSVRSVAPWEAHALDGKTVRGTGTHGHPLHLVSEVCHGNGQVVQQQAVDLKSNEIPLVQRMLAGRDLQGLLFTMDALHTQRRTAQQIVAQGCQYLIVVKANQPELYHALEEWFAQPAWNGEQAEHVTTISKGHGRHEWRTLERRAVMNLPWDWPGVQQVIRRHTVADLVTTGQHREYVSFGLTNLLRLAGWTNIAAALRHFGVDYHGALQFIGLLC